MNRISMIAFVLCALLSFKVQAQDPQKPAAGDAAQAGSAPATPGEPDPKIVEGIMACLGEGLPEGWKKAWFVMNEIGRSNDSEGATRQFEATFYYATDPSDTKGRQFKPCGANRIVEGVIALNAYLQPSQRRWGGMTMTFLLDGRYEASYDFSPRKPAPIVKPAAAPAAKPAAKKKSEAPK
jgi:hypothetical protein